jgi:predicted nucleotidyltransferase component of viral defense system
MIPLAYIQEWRESVPWQDIEMVEQDLVICRALIEIFSDEFLASNLVFRGGTALHKLYIKPQTRYSEDIDLVQKSSGPIHEIIDHLRHRLSFLGQPVIKQKANNNTLIFRFESESISPVPLRLKIEINCREHFSILGLEEVDFSINTRWFSGGCKLQTYRLEEMLAKKIRALYQRRKGRGLYDLYKAMNQFDIDTEILLDDDYVNQDDDSGF